MPMASYVLCVHIIPFSNSTFYSTLWSYIWSILRWEHFMVLETSDHVFHLISSKIWWNHYGKYYCSHLQLRKLKVIVNNCCLKSVCILKKLTSTSTSCGVGSQGKRQFTTGLLPHCIGFLGLQHSVTMRLVTSNNTDELLQFQKLEV